MSRPVKWVAIATMVLATASATAGPRDLARKPVKGDEVCVEAAPTKLRDDVADTVAITGGVVELRLCVGGGARTPTRIGAGVYKTLPAWANSNRWIREAQAELARLRAQVAELQAQLAACTSK